MAKQSLLKTMSQLYDTVKANKHLLIIGVVVIALFVVMRNAVTKMILTEMTEFELYAATAIVRMIVAPIVVFFMWRSGTVRFDRLLALSPMAKGVVVGTTLLGIVIFFLSVTILKQHMLTKIMTLHTAFQIILACLIGYFLFNEKLVVQELVGVFLILVGMVMMYYKGT
jgi:drug/metabolite transporter (DMT)-like permease